MKAKPIGKGKILPFRQDSGFYLKRGAKQLERNDLLAALQRYRQAYASDPSNVDSCLAVAEILHQMRRFDESNRILFVYLSMHEPAAECFFGIACNFYGMHEFDYAAESLESYLQLDPNGPYAYDAEDFLEVLDDDAELSAATGISEEEDFDTLTICTRAQHLINAGQLEIAAELLQQHLADLPSARRAKNLLSATLYCAGDTSAARSVAEAVLADDPNDIAARCNHILLLHEAGEEEAARAELAAMPIASIELPEQLAGLALIQLELEQTEQARQTLQKLLLSVPYDETALHQMGYCCHLLGDLETAENCYRKLLRIDPADTIARYYLKAVRAEREDSASRRVYWSLPYRVPLPEMLRRMNYINRMFSLTQAEVRELWENDESFRNLLHWVFTLQDDRSKRAVLSFYYTMGDAAAERALRGFLLRTDQPDAIKREVLGLLKRMGAKEPYMAYLESQWIQGRVSMLTLPQNLPAAYENVMHVLMQQLAKQANGEAIASHAAAIYHRYLKQFGKPRYPRISENQEISFAAALEFLASRLASMPVTEEEICERYRVTRQRLRNAVAKFEPFTEV